MDIEIVKSKIKLMLGDPIVSLIDEDANAINNAINIALYQYWISFPYVYRTKITIDGRTSPVYVTYNDVIEAAFDDIEDETQKALLINNAYVMGIVRINDDQTLLGTGAYYINPVDSWILGIQGTTPNGITLTDPAKMHQTMTNLKTMQRLFSGKVNLKVDDIKKRFELILPIGSLGSILVDYALGFKNTLGGTGSDESDLDEMVSLINYNMLSIFTKMTAKYYLEALIAARTSVGLSSDFSISVDDIKSKLSKIEEDLKTEIPNASFQPIILG